MTQEDLMLSPFVGKRVRLDDFHKFREISKISDLQYMELFGITPTIEEYWQTRGIDYALLLKLDNDIIVSAHVDKYRMVGYGHGRPGVSVLTPTKQELRIAKRVLSYVTKL